MSPTAQIALFSGGALLLIAIAVYAYFRMRSTPEKRELKRRQDVNRVGRLADALVTEVIESNIYYSYTVRGVQYMASQDVSTLRDHLPSDPERLIGVVSLKYAPKNPANSILVCEEWSGLRIVDRKAG